MEKQAIDSLVGARIRQLRQKHGLSARELASLAGVTPSYLSRLENGKFSPTISALTKVVQAMGESVGQIFGEESSREVVRYAERPVVRNRGVTDYRITSAHAQRLQVLEAHVDPGEGSGEDAYSHPGDEECVLVLEGVLTLWLDGVRHDLTEGDSITFPCRAPHRWENPGDKLARVLWVITPAASY